MSTTFYKLFEKVVIFLSIILIILIYPKVKKIFIQTFVRNSRTRFQNTNICLYKHLFGGLLIV
nr:MAG TPA: hypothetical protein [Caudoviricetes sp.]